MAIIKDSKIFRLCLLVFLASGALPQISSAQPSRDARVIIHEKLLNKFLAGVGVITGRGQQTVGKGFLEKTIDYQWWVRQARVEIEPGNALFMGKAQVKTDHFSYNPDVEGKVKITYDSQANKVFMEIEEAKLELYIKLFGKKIHITNVDIARFYGPKFDFAGPLPAQGQAKVKLPDGTTKTLWIVPENDTLELVKDQIIVSSDIRFSEKPPLGPND